MKLYSSSLNIVEKLLRIHAGKTKLISQKGGPADVDER
jgi:hypothetical protein